MNIEEVRLFALSLPEVEEQMPFGPTVLVFKSNTKIFLLLPLDELELQFNVKCDPEKAIQQRMEYPDCILPGWHMNKKHWNTILANGQLSDTNLKELITDSYQLVQPKPKKRKSAL